MAANGRPVLGIDIGPTEVYVVELKGSWPDYQLVRAGKAPIPSKSVDGGRVVDPGAIASALQALMDEMGIITRDAVMSIAESCVVTRVLDIPAVPANELRAVIEGELAHYQVLGNTAGAFDFMPLAKRDNESEAGPQALVMAAEETVVAAYRAVAEQAGLNLVAMEPALLASYRAGFADMQSRPVAACLAIGRHESEITVTCNDQIRLYRRIDIGRETLILDRNGAAREAPRPTSGSGRVPFGEVADEQEQEAEQDDGQPRVINPSAASSLTVELQRSLDYYSSQSPNEATVDLLVLSVPTPELAALETWFTQAISIETKMARLPKALQGGLMPNDPEGARYICAAGLAMRELSGLPPSMPRFDLSSQQRNEVVAQTAKKTLTLSFAAAAATLVLGAVLALQVGLRANAEDRVLAHVQEDLKAQERVRQDYITSVQARQDLLKSLRTQGFPFPRIMDSVSDSIAPNVGITQVSLDGAGKLTVNGDATNEKQVIKTLENLRKIPFFESVSMDTFDKQAPTQATNWLVRFQISCQLTSTRATAAAAPAARRERLP